MKKPILLILLYMITCAVPCWPEAGVGVGVDLWGGFDDRPKKQERPAEPFTAALADHFKRDRQELRKLWFRGYGRNELIKLLLIAEQSGADFTDLIKQRDRKAKLADLAAKNGVDWEQVVAQAPVIRQQIDRDALTVIISTVTPATR